MSHRAVLALSLALPLSLAALAAPAAASHGRDRWERWVRPCRPPARAVHVRSSACERPERRACGADLHLTNDYGTPVVFHVSLDSGPHGVVLGAGHGGGRFGRSGVGPVRPGRSVTVELDERARGTWHRAGTVRVHVVVEDASCGRRLDHFHRNVRLSRCACGPRGHGLGDDHGHGRHGSWQWP